MGVIGLWGILEPAGKPISLEALENKTLAVDVSIWLHQAVKGFRDKNGQAVSNAHLLGLFHRICKLMTYRIKPIFVFDGGVPALKQQTMAARRKRKDLQQMKAQETGKKILENYLKQHAVNAALGKGNPPKPISSGTGKQKEDVFILPETFQALVEDSDDEKDAGDSDDEEWGPIPEFAGNIHDVDVTSEAFLTLPATVRHEILLELKDRRKQNSWGRLHEMPKEFGEFSSFQVDRLLKRRRLQQSLQNVENEIGAARHGMSFSEEDKEKQHKLLWGDRVVSDDALRVAWYEMTTSSKEKDQKGVTGAGTSVKKEAVDGDKKTKEEASQSSSQLAGASSAAMKLATDFMSVSHDCRLSKQEMLAAVQSTSRNPQPTSSAAVHLSSDDDADFVEVHFDSGPRKPSKKEEEEEEEDIFADVFKDADASSFAALDSILAKSVVKPAEGKSPPVIAPALREEAKPLQKPLLNLGGGVSLSSSSSSASSRSSSPSPPPSPIPVAPMKRLIDIYDDAGEDEEEEDEPAVDEVEDVEDYEQKEDLVAEFLKYQQEDAEQVDQELPKSPEIVKVVQPETSKSPEIMDDLEPESPEANEDELVHRLMQMEDQGAEVGQKQGRPLEENDAEKEDETKEVEEIKEEQTSPSVQENQEKPKQDVAHKAEEQKIPSGQETRVNVEPEVEETDANQPEQPEVREEPLTSPKRTEETTEEEAESPKTPPLTRPLSTPVHSPTKAVLSSPVAQRSPIVQQSWQDHYQSRFTEEERKKLEEIQSILERERSSLSADVGKIDRMAATMSEQIYYEAQELLRLFGIPFITAPMEAEAQCAFLDIHNLTQGTITDDSDIWLFGGRRVYKNFFNPDKTVEYFEFNDINRRVGLSRDSMISFAFLCGSDYCEGLQGIGAVAALELIARFPGEGVDSLQKMKNWWSKFVEKEDFEPREQCLRKLKIADLSGDFPSPHVVDAYKSPQIDESTEKFVFSVPDLAGIRDYLKEKLGWPFAKTDETLLPVLKRMNLFGKQTRIDSYFAVNPPKTAKVASKRVQKVIDQLTGNAPAPRDEEDDDDDFEAPRRSASSRRGRGRRGGSNGGSSTTRGRGRKRQTADNEQDDEAFLESHLSQMPEEWFNGASNDASTSSGNARRRGDDDDEDGEPVRKRRRAAPRKKNPLLAGAKDPIRTRIAQHLIDSASKKRVTVKKINSSLVDGDDTEGPIRASSSKDSWPLPSTSRKRNVVPVFTKPKTVEELQAERENEKAELKKKAAAVLRAERARGRGRGRGRGGRGAAKKRRVDVEPEFKPTLSEESSSDD